MNKEETKKYINKLGKELEHEFGDCVLIVAKDVVTLFSTNEIN